MRVLVLTSSYPLRPDDAEAAAGLFVRDFVLEAARQGHALRVVTQDRRGGRLDDAGIEVVRFPWLGNRPLSTLRLSRPRDLLAIGSILVRGGWAVESAIRRERPDLIVAMWTVPAGLGGAWARRLHGVPYRVWALGSDIWIYGSNPLTRPVVRRVLEGADRVFADGPGLAEDVQRLSGVRCAFLPSSRRLPTGMAAPDELDRRKTNFVFVGRFHENKGVDLLLQALEGLDAEARRSCRFHLLGSGPLEAFVRDAIREADLGACVSIPGFAGPERCAAFLEHAHALVVPSRVESIPLVLSDAAQARCPLIVTRVGDMARVVEEFGSGLVVDPSPESIREGILRCREMERDHFAEGLERMAAVFSLAASVGRMLE